MQGEREKEGVNHRRRGEGSKAQEERGKPEGGRNDVLNEPCSFTAYFVSFKIIYQLECINHNPNNDSDSFISRNNTHLFIFTNNQYYDKVDKHSSFLNANVKRKPLPIYVNKNQGIYTYIYYTDRKILLSVPFYVTETPVSLQHSSV